MAELLEAGAPLEVMGTNETPHSSLLPLSVTQQQSGHYLLQELRLMQQTQTAAQHWPSLQARPPNPFRHQNLPRGTKSASPAFDKSLQS